MRLLFLTLALALTASAAAAEDPPSAQEALVERLGLLEIDARCRLLAPGPRSALRAGAGQARGALLRAGWSPERVSALESAVARAARERSCTDPRTQTAAADARDAYAVWANAAQMEFPGWSRAWTARRATGPNGWRLSQTIDSPATAAIGVRELQNAQTFALILPGVHASGARLILRNTRRSQAGALDLPSRVARGLEAGAPVAGMSTLVFDAVRRTERRPGGAMQTVYTFHNDAFAALMALDPRESARIELSAGRTTQVLYVEVGDVAAARAFLALRAD